MKSNLSLIVAALLAGCLLLLSDPFMLWMPPMAAMAVLLASAVLLAVWAGFMLREKAADEREAHLRMNAGRAGYLAGLATLTVALVVQGLSHHVDPWVAGALVVMVFAKLLSRYKDDE